MLKKYLQKNNITNSQFCRDIGISRPTLIKILSGESKHLFYEVALKIKVKTGLQPWDYMKGLDDIKKLAKRNNQ